MFGRVLSLDLFSYIDWRGKRMDDSIYDIYEAVLRLDGTIKFKSRTLFVITMPDDIPIIESGRATRELVKVLTSDGLYE